MKKVIQITQASHIVGVATQTLTAWYERKLFDYQGAGGGPGFYRAFSFPSVCHAAAVKRLKGGGAPDAHIAAAINLFRGRWDGQDTGAAGVLFVWWGQQVGGKGWDLDGQWPPALLREIEANTPGRLADLFIARLDMRQIATVVWNLWPKDGINA